MDLQIGFGVIAAAQELRRLMDDNLRRCGLSAAQIHILGYLDHCRANGVSCSQRELAYRCGNVRAPSMTGVLRVLEAQGYIVREQGTDARVKLVRLTERGGQIAADCKAFIERVEAQLERGFTREELDAGQNFLSRIRENLAAFEAGEGEDAT